MSDLFGKSEAYNAPVPQALPPIEVPDPTQPDAVGAAAREQAKARAKRGLMSTILTSPTGLQSNSAIGSTLLGS